MVEGDLCERFEAFEEASLEIGQENEIDQIYTKKNLDKLNHTLGLNSYSHEPYMAEAHFRKMIMDSAPKIEELPVERRIELLLKIVTVASICRF